MCVSVYRCVPYTCAITLLGTRMNFRTYKREYGVYVYEHIYIRIRIHIRIYIHTSVSVCLCVYVCVTLKYVFAGKCI